MNTSSQGQKNCPTLATLQGPWGLNHLESIMQQQKPSSKFDYFRSLYESIDVTEYRAYPIDWIPHFSPIESMAWGEIRYLGLPFWPQFPIGQYFADFADPIKKIVIECDGKEFHSREKDKPRDAFMNANGWTVYRISGADCNRIITPPWEEIADKDIDRDSHQARSLYDHWFHKSIDGLVMSIAVIHYGRHMSYERANSMASSVLSCRRARGF